MNDKEIILEALEFYYNALKGSYWDEDHEHAVKINEIRNRVSEA